MSLRNMPILIRLPELVLFEPCHENLLFAYAKTKAQISCAVTAQLINAFVFFHS